MGRITRLTIVLAFVVSGGNAQGLSGTAAAFVDVGIGAKAAGLGGAYTAVAQSANAVFWNPAGLTGTNARAVEFSYVNQFGLIPYNAVAGSWGFGESHAVGMGMLSSGDDQLRETTVLLSYGFNGDGWLPGALAGLRAGVSVKYHTASFGKNGFQPGDYSLFTEQEIAAASDVFVSGSASGFGADLGLMFAATEKLQLGLAWRDFISSVSWDNGQSTYSEENPARLALAAAYHTKMGVMVAAEYENALAGDRANRLRFGTEKALWQNLSIRGGVGHTLAADSWREYAFGMSVYQDFQGFGRLLLDYAYHLHPIENMHRFSLGFMF